jgi:hypothetical protein
MRIAPGAAVTLGSWGRWPSLVLATAAVELEVVGEVGGRVVSLRDRRRDREWLMAGEPPSEQEARDWSAEVAAFWGRESFGWDECLPTVSVCPDPRDPGGLPLRDHGDQWGRGTYVSIDEEAGAVTHTWGGPRWPYRMARRLSIVDEATVLAEYEVVSLADEDLPMLWSQHPVLRLEPGTLIDVPGVTHVRRTGQRGIELPEEPAWPVAATLDRGDTDLSRVRQGEGWAAKLYARPSGSVAAVAPDGARLGIDWDHDFAPALGIWLSAGGWPPQGPPCDQVALEPTTSVDDDLATAMAAGRDRTLPAHGRVAWWVRLGLA